MTPQQHLGIWWPINAKHMTTAPTPSGHRTNTQRESHPGGVAFCMKTGAAGILCAAMSGGSIYVGYVLFSVPADGGQQRVRQGGRVRQAAGDGPFAGRAGVPAHPAGPGVPGEAGAGGDAAIGGRSVHHTDQRELR